MYRTSTNSVYLNNDINNCISAVLYEPFYYNYRHPQIAMHTGGRACMRASMCLCVTLCVCVFVRVGHMGLRTAMPLIMMSLYVVDNRYEYAFHFPCNSKSEMENIER